MSPPAKVFPVSQMEVHVQADVKGKKRKVPGGGDVDLSKCALKEMAQYRCFVDNPHLSNSPDKKGTFTVETTAWEGLNAHQHRNAQVADSSKENEKSKNQHEYHHQWSQSWKDDE
ncbi:hypothetical protein CCHL11_09332 [Colletotrichum chlorophyti]|uniref:Uncharacterized protein n=1 Tax=Colletotrichum chlorophyti TaxID=708187 RepID=A0A1Q8RPU9_9PEZI|nr:hypothetical protein CCHL11_09332 [Colletotrichum chlorophyti]